MRIVNTEYLPNYVFTKKYEKIIFFHYDNFVTFDHSALFFRLYYSCLQQLKIDAFDVFEISFETNQFNILKRYDISTINEIEINKSFFTDDFGTGIKSYFFPYVNRAVFACEGDQIAVYIERDLEAIVIGCSGEISEIFLTQNTGSVFLDVEGYIRLIDHFYAERKDEPIFLDIKKRLRANYPV